jgi:hypothetical protein
MIADCDTSPRAAAAAKSDFSRETVAFSAAILCADNLSAFAPA